MKHVTGLFAFMQNTIATTNCSVRTHARSIQDWYYNTTLGFAP